MANEDTKLNVVAAVRRISDSDYACVVRWVLGTGDELPHDDDRFDVKLSVIDKGGVVTPIATQMVAPRLFAMLEPPRVERPIPYSGSQGVRWLVADKPAVGVDCDAANSGSLDGKAFGVCHLLREAEPSRVAWRAAGIVQASIARRRPAQEALARFAASADDEYSARVFAAALVKLDVRPLHLRRHLIEAQAQLVEYGRTLASGRPAPIPLLLALDGADVGKQFMHAALVMHALTDRATLERLDTAVNGATQTRKHIRIRALHGGEMIDYWADPDGVGGAIDEMQRGKRYPASELIGSGTTIPIDMAKLKEWVEAEKTLLIEVEQHARDAGKKPDRPLDSDIPGNLDMDGARGQFDAGSWSLDHTFLKRAHLLGSSYPPPPPLGADVDYSMNHADAAATKKFPGATGPALNYATGDGRIEIRITPPKQDDDRVTVAAFNVYGMWETDAATPYFDDPSKNPSSQELRPWLVTRRYSFERDLKEAFPDVAGARHPALLDLLSSPPWQPVLRRPERVSDRTDGVNETLPNFAPQGGAIFAFDIRKGMRSGTGAPANVFAGWDLSAPAATDWTPERRRDGTLLPADATNPQRYRFWVTSIDAFEQESDPVPVRTNDVDAGQTTASFLFAPVRRAPILGPPGDNRAEGTAFALGFDAATTTLSLNFETPWENQISGRIDPSASGPTPRVDAQRLEAIVAVWRRRLVRRVESEGYFGALAASRPQLPDLPQWLDLNESLVRDGWQLLRVVTVPPPTSGHLWTAAFTLPTEYSGWEYIAGAGFQVRSSAAGFFSPNVLMTGASQGRLAVLARRLEDGTYAPEPTRVNETPRASDVAASKPLALPNQHPARAPELDAAGTKAWPARPVPPPPGVRRDLVLLRLLTHGASRGGTSVEPIPWHDTGVPLTTGQAAMCDTAIARTAIDGAPLPPATAELKVARELLAGAFNSKAAASGGPLRQHPTLGFRGFLDLRWTYAPLESRAPTMPEAEAVNFRLYGVRVPTDAAAARNFATVIADGTLAVGEYQLTLSKGDPDGWHAIAKLQQPALARIVPVEGGATIVAEVVGTREVGAVKYIRPATPANKTIPALPQKAQIYLYLAQPIADVEVSSFEAPSNHRLLLPIGGGEPETFGWWVVGVSAQGRESPADTRRAVVLGFGSTLEPRTPAAFHVSIPTDFTAHVLDFLSHREWLPTDMNKAEDTKYFPRLVLTWEAFDASFKANLVVEREERAVAQPPSAMRFTAAPSSWAAIKAIEATAEGQNIEAANIEAIRGNWLLGNPVEVEGLATELYEHVDREPNRRLDASFGLKVVPSPEPPDESGAVRQRPAFIDYYGRNTNRQQTMDSNWEFRYRLRAYLDLGPDLPDNWRYLTSSPTAWSTWLLPETPPLEVFEHVKTIDERPDLLKPQVKIRIVPGKVPPSVLAAMRLQVRALEHRWEYRVLVRRRIDAPTPSTGGTMRPVWIDVGKPAALADKPLDVIDDEIDRGWPEHSPKFRYSVSAQQFLIIVTDSGEVEKLVRGFETKKATKEFDVIVDAPSASTTEVEVTKTIYVA
jgi:hypothetical protein